MTTINDIAVTCTAFPGTALTGHETREEITAIEKATPPGQLDRFGRSRELMSFYAYKARNSSTLDEFFEWWTKFIAYTSEVRHPSVTGSPVDDAIILAGYGLAGEGGEVSDIIKKIYFHDKSRHGSIDGERLSKLTEEWGDRFWYDGQLAYHLAANMQGDLGALFRLIIQGNMDKLTHDLRAK